MVEYGMFDDDCPYYEGRCYTCGLLWSGSSSEECCPRCGSRYTKMKHMGGPKERESAGPLTTAYRTALALVVLVVMGMALYIVGR